MAAYTVSGKFWQIRIQFGWQLPKMKLEAHFATKISEKDLDVRVIVDLATNLARIDDPHNPNSQDNGGVTVRPGPGYIDIDVDFTPGINHVSSDLIMDCWVRLDYFGDESILLPKMKFYYGTKSLGDRTTESSLDKL